MSKTKGKIMSIILSASMIINGISIPAFSMDIDDQSDNISKMEKMLDENISSDCNLEETIRITVMLDEPSASLKASSLEEAANKENEVKESQKDIIDKVQKITGNCFIQSFGYLVNGFTIEGKKSDILKISKIDGVKSVKESVKFEDRMIDSNNITKAYNVWQNYGIKGENTIISIIDTGVDPYHKDFQNIESDNLKMTKAQAEEKITQLGYGKYYSDKIPFGYNYADNNDNIKNESEAHGMHVSGIAAANGEIKGVANEAQLLAMKVGTDEGYFYNEDVIHAIEDSVKLGADVINMSFGSSATYSSNDDLLREAIINANKNGVLCVNACGNSGKSNYFENSSAKSANSSIIFDAKDTSTADVPASDILSVASIDEIKENTDRFRNNRPFNNDTSNNNYSGMSSFSSWGPSPDLELKPEITAPGGNIKSTINDDSYGIYSGTSMASPNVAGGCALILQSLNNKKIDLSGEDKNNLVKNILMNTAKMLADDSGTIYSPRQQGAGLMQLENAIKNNVTATSTDDKAYIAFKNISARSVNFSIKLTNYGQEDVMYDLRDEDIYTEITDKNSSKEKKIDGGKINFEKQNVIIKQGDTEVINGTLTIPDNFKKQNFVEGFISFISENKAIPDLSIPFLGFFGDYSEETIIDAPVYEENSLFGITGLGKFSEDGLSFDYYGQSKDNNDHGHDNKFDNSFNDFEDYKEIAINKDNVAFSPNGDGKKDDVQVLSYFLRNAKKYSISVVDENKKYIGNIMEFNDVAKNVYADYSEYGIQDLLYSGYSWDGTYYNAKTGENDVASDGQYYIRLTSSGYTDNAKEQVIDLPVKVDNQKPIVKIEKITTARGFGRKSYTICWSASDNLSNMANKAVVMLNNDSGTITNVTDIKETNGEYQGQIQVNGNISAIYSVHLSVMDNAGNVTTVTTGENNLEIIDNDPPKITSISPYKEGKIYATNKTQIAFTVNGEDDNGITCIATNESTGIDYESQMNSNGQTSVQIPLTSGTNLISVQLQDESQNVSDKKYFTVVYVDGMKSFSAGFANLDSIEYLNGDDTKDDVYELAGYVSNVPNNITINGQKINVNDDLSFNYSLKLNQGINKIELDASSANNKIQRYPDNYNLFNNIEDIHNSYRIYYDSIAPTLTLSNKDIETLKSDKSSIEIKGTVFDNTSDYFVFINGNQVLSTKVNNMQPGVVNDSNALKREFSKEIEIAEGTSIITIDVVDIMGNKTQKKIKVTKDAASSDPSNNQNDTNKNNETEKNETNNKENGQSNKTGDGFNLFGMVAFFSCSAYVIIKKLEN